MKPFFFFDFWGTLYRENGWIPGIKEVLIELEKSAHLVIISSINSAQLRQWLDEANMTHLFVNVIGDAELSKAEVMKKIGTEGAWFVTDRAKDVVQGQAAKVPTIAVDWGMGSKKELEASLPTKIIHNPLELMEILAK